MKKQHDFNKSTDVIVLSELEESERMGRVCRALEYQPKLVHMSTNTDLQTKNVPEPITSVKAKDTEVPSKKHVCELCGVEYLNRRNLITHRMIHTGETPYKCQLCGKGFRRSDWLAKHMRTHRDPGQERFGHERMKKKTKQYACDQCEKTFQERKAFESHLRTHTGERPYACTICGKRFYDEGCLRKHLKCHWDDRPFTCSECGHSFKHMGSLNKHKRIHTGEKAYSCRACGRRFRYNYSVTLHLKTLACKKVKI